MSDFYNNNSVTFTGPRGSFSGLTNDRKIAIASSVTAFAVGSILIFIIGCMCGRFCRKDTKVTAGTAGQCEKTEGAPY